jgi:outer membrane protein TolC
MKAFLRNLILAAAMGASPSLAAPPPLMVDEVLATVRRYYPPLLAAWLQQDIVNGRVRQAQGAFDTVLSATLGLNPLNYYDGSYGSFLLEQPLAAGGANLYGGYRLSSGFLADYDRKNRTANGGEAVVGLRLPLLRDSRIDSRRAAVDRAVVDRELADPFILRQYLDFHRAARLSYFDWLAAGKRLAAAEAILRIAQERDKSLKEMIKRGAMATIIETDNRRLVVSREIGVVNAQRSFESAAIKLSLFLRELTTGDPIIAPRLRLPADFPGPVAPGSLPSNNDRERAVFRRPETREIDLLIARGGIDRKLALNNLKPNLELAVELNQEIGTGRPSDINQTEVTGLLKFSVPIGRNEAKGRLEAINGDLARLEQQRQFTRERILTDADDAFSAVRATYEALARTGINVSLAEELEAAENERFRQGATDLLALQIREQATFDARVLEIDAKLACFRAMADYLAAVASDVPPSLFTSSK